MEAEPLNFAAFCWIAFLNRNSLEQLDTPPERDRPNLRIVGV